jgi:hypothetical protein
MTPQELLSEIKEDCSEYLEMLSGQSQKDQMLINLLAKKLLEEKFMVEYLMQRLKRYEKSHATTNKD